MTIPLKVCPRHEQAHRVTEPCPYCDDRPKTPKALLGARVATLKRPEESVFYEIGVCYPPWDLRAQDVGAKGAITVVTVDDATGTIYFEEHP